MTAIETIQTRLTEAIRIQSEASEIVDRLAKELEEARTQRNIEAITQGVSK